MMSSLAARRGEASPAEPGGRGRAVRTARFRRLVRRCMPGEALLRNGHVLFLNSLSTAGFGGLYWILASHWYGTASVGLGFAAVSAMMFLGGAGQLNLANVLVRFVPAVNEGVRSLVLRAYAGGLAATLLMAIMFLVFLPGISPRLSDLGGPLLGGGFVAATAGYAIFILQDGALTGMRRPDWVLLENTVFGVVKIVFLGALAFAEVGNGILLSWFLGLAVSVTLANVLLFGRAIPRHRRARPGTESGELMPSTRYIVADYVGELWWTAATTLLPLVVLALVGPEQTAYFSLAWVVASMLYLFSINMSSSLVVEGVSTPAMLPAYARRTLRHTAGMLVAGVVVVVAAAPFILAAFGAEYTRHGTVTLRLLALSALPNVVIAIAVGVWRAQRRMGHVTGVLAALCSMVIALTAILTPRIGIAGAGAAWLVAQNLTAGWLLWRRSLWLPAARRDDDRVRGLAVSFVRVTAYRLTHPARRAADLFTSHRLVRGLSPGGDLRIRGSTRTLSDLLVVRAGGDPELAIKCPRSMRARTALDRQARVLSALATEERLGDWRRLLPPVHSCELRAATPYTVEGWMPGTTASALLRGYPDAAGRLADRAAAAIGELHRAIGRREIIGADHLRRWIDGPLAVLDRDLALCREGWPKIAMEALRACLYEGFTGRRIVVTWTHGDYTPGNVLFSEDLRDVTGIIDWGGARPDGPAPLDAQLFMLGTQWELGRREIGALVVDALRCRSGGSTGSPALALGLWPPAVEAGEPDRSSLLLLTWLWHIADNLTKSAHYQHSGRWLTGNVIPVLRMVAP